jgi:hypothetical protein
MSFTDFLTWPFCSGSPVCPGDPALQHGDMDIQHGLSAWTYSMDYQYSMYMQQVHPAWSSNMAM